MRLPPVSNDEITDLSNYFNQTISKIGSSIKTVDENSAEMRNIGSELERAAPSGRETNTGSMSVTQKLAEEVHKPDELTLVITDSMNETASGTIQICNTLQDVNNIGQKNKQSIENFSVEAGKFKV